MSAEIKLVNKDGITLKTAGTYCADDIKITIDDPQLTSYNIRQGATILGVQGNFPQGIFPSGSIMINNTQTTDVTRFATASVNSAGIASGNIKEGVSILGVSGILKDSSTCTAGASDIKSGETAVVNNKLVTGTMQKFEPDATGYTPTTTNKTLQTNNKYLESNITIKGDSDLVAANIKKGVTIFDVTGTFTSDATASASKILKGETAYVNGSKVTGTIESKATETYTPGTADKTISAKQYLSGDQIIKGDTNLTASNIKKDVTIFGVKGTLTTGDDDSKDLTAAAGDILKGKTALVKGNVITGTIESIVAKEYTPTTTDQTISSGQYLSGNQTIKGDSDLVAANIKQDVTIFNVKGTFTSDATATANKILKNETAYVKGSKVTGTIETKTSSDLTAKDDTVTVPAGYYASQVTKAIAAGSASTPATTITVAPTISIDSTGKITAKNDTSNTKKITPTIKAGYVSEGTEGTITVDGSKDYQMTTQGAKEWTPKTTDQSIESGTYLTGKQTIKGDTNLKAEYIKKDIKIFGVTGTLTTGDDDSKDLTASAGDILEGKTALVKGAIVTGTIASKAAETYTPGTTDKTIAKNQYLSGVQTIKGDANLVASNIKKDVTIFGVTGTCEEDSGASVSGTTLILGKAAVSGTTVSL